MAFPAHRDLLATVAERRQPVKLQVGRCARGPIGSSRPSGAHKARVLLLWRAERDPLTLHLSDNGLGPLVAIGGELSGLAGEGFELLAQFDRLLHGRFL